MRKFCIFILVFLLVVSGISAVCENGQIDINEASAEKLQEIIQIGESRAKQIIELRKEKLFGSLDDLSRVNGISIDGSNLKNIKSQGLACVDNEEKDKEESEQEITEEVQETEEKVEITENEIIEEEQKIETIKLGTKTIKSENNTEIDKTNIIKYGFVIFCALLGFLFILKNKKYKTEFD